MGSGNMKFRFSIWPTDLFEKYQELLVADSLKIAEKVREGGYVGTRGRSKSANAGRHY